MELLSEQSAVFKMQMVLMKSQLQLSELQVQYYTRRLALLEQPDESNLYSYNSDSESI